MCGKRKDGAAGGMPEDRAVCFSPRYSHPPDVLSLS
jgi:hypothetical protein